MIKKQIQRQSTVVLDERSLAATAGGEYDIPYCGTPWGPRGPLITGPILTGVPTLELPRGIVIGS